MNTNDEKLVLKEEVFESLAVQLKCRTSKI